MKVGIRTPILKKRICARTTGKYKRKIKSTLNPLYGKKGMGYIKNPKRALKNKIYHATTVDALTPMAPSAKKKTKRMKPKETTGKANPETGSGIVIMETTEGD